MPFIDSKITIPVSGAQRENLKTELGKAVSILHKPESFLMVGFEDNYDLYFGGEKMERGAYVAVSLFGAAQPADYEKMTAEISRIYAKELDIAARDIYITYHEVNNWGWNGKNF